MRRILLILLLLALAAGGLFWLVRADAGYVLLQYGETRIETTLWFGLLLLLVIGCVLWLLLRILGGVARILRWMRGGPSAPGSGGSRDRTAQGLRAFFEGDCWCGESVSRL